MEIRISLAATKRTLTRIAFQTVELQQAVDKRGRKISFSVYIAIANAVTVAVAIAGAVADARCHRYEPGT
ncbi:hypothetical protein PG990_015388 [Apiospora arundinis]|uniref:Uncharacterized protein n=1 Tax=Apiospora arundinis TaxID=335852 RepID=A0ABR2HMQ4_9PEZI